MTHDCDERCEPDRAYDDDVVQAARQIARQELASLCGLVERRLQEYSPHNEALAALRSIFGELLRDFSQTPDEPGK